MIDGPRSLSSLDSYKSMVYKSGETTSTRETKVKKPRQINWEKEYTLLSTSRMDIPEADRQMIDLTVMVGYSDDGDNIINVLKSALKADDNILENPKPDFGIGDTDTRNLEIRIKCWCKKKVYWDVISSLVKDIKIRFFSNGITYKSVAKS